MFSGTGGSIDKQGSGSLTLSGTNTYTGGTAITAGRLTGTRASAFGTGGITLSGATIDLINPSRPAP